MEMNSKQWAWLYKQIKDYIGSHVGLVPDDEAAGGLMELYENTMKITEESRKDSKDIDEQLGMVFGILFKIVHALELEKKPL